MTSERAAAWAIALLLSSCSRELLAPAADATSVSPVELTPADLVGPSYEALFVEIDGVGVDPAMLTESVGQFTTKVGELATGGYLAKSSVIEVDYDERIARAGTQGSPYTLDELRELVRAHRSVAPPDGAAGLYILAVDAGYETDTETDYVLGFADGGSAIVVFRPNVLKTVGPRAGVQKARVRAVESTLLLHEFGHLLGLVNDGTPMSAPHQDAEHGHHDTDASCIMHWEADRPKMAVKLSPTAGGIDPSLAMPTFCGHCLEDLRLVANP